MNKPQHERPPDLSPVRHGAVLDADTLAPGETLSDEEYRRRHAQFEKETRDSFADVYERHGIAELQQHHDVLGERIRELRSRTEAHETAADEAHAEGNGFLLRRFEALARKAHRLANRLEFRRCVCETVIGEVEATGSPLPATDDSDGTDGAPAHAETVPDALRGKPKTRQYAEEIVEAYRDDPASLPETSTAFQAWIGPRGEGKYTRLQTVIREAGISDEYENGNPESFCRLLERLVKRHYEE